MERLGASVGDDLDGGLVGQGRLDIDEFSVDLACDRSLGEPRSDRTGEVEDGRAFREILVTAVGQLHRDLWHDTCLL